MCGRCRRKCRGPQSHVPVKKSWNISGTSVWTRKLTGKLQLRGTVALQLTRKKVDTDEAFEEEVTDFKSGDRPGLSAGTPLLNGFKATLSLAANHVRTFGIMHIDVSRAYLHAKAQSLVLARLPVCWIVDTVNELRRRMSYPTQLSLVR